MDGSGPEGEQAGFPLTIRPNQSLLVEELKSKFENIDRRFDSLFEHMNNDGNLNLQPKTVAPIQTVKLSVNKSLMFWISGLAGVLKIISN